MVPYAAAQSTTTKGLSRLRGFPRDSPDAIDAAQKPRPGQAIVELHELLFHPPTVRMGKRIGGVVANGAHIADVVVQAWAAHLIADSV